MGSVATKAGVPCSLVHDLNQVLKSEQTQSRELLLNWVQDSLGEVKGLNFPYKFLNSETKVTRPVPKLGEHSNEILKDFGYSENQISHLKNEGII